MILIIKTPWHCITISDNDNINYNLSVENKVKKYKLSNVTQTHNVMLNVSVWPMGVCVCAWPMGVCVCVCVCVCS